MVELCEAFGKSERDKEELMETNVENDVNELEVVEGIPESRKKRLFSNII